MAPQHPAHFLFQIDSQEQRVGSRFTLPVVSHLLTVLLERETLRLSLTYRTLREGISPHLSLVCSDRFLHVEIEAKIAYNVKQVLSGGREHLQDPAIGLLVDALSTSADWVELYVATGELEIMGLDKEEGELGDAVRAVALVLFHDSGKGFRYSLLNCRDLTAAEKVLYLLVESTTGDSL